MAPIKTKKLPERLKQKKRPPVQEFDTKERLFQRFDELITDRPYIYPNQVRFPEFSVNRERFSEPDDVLLPDYLDWGIVSFKIEDIPGKRVIGEGTSGETTYSFVAVHVPIPDNYSHSEIRTEKNGVYTKGKKISNKNIKRYFRYNAVSLT